MNYTAVVTQIRQYCPVFGGRVAGAANFAKALATEGMMALPAAYVVPGDDEVGENTELTGIQQVVTERVSIIAELPNDADRRGQKATTLYDTVRTQLWGALLAWHLDTDKASRGLYYVGGQLLDLDRARLFYAWSFAQDITITEQDGFQPDAVPLTGITFTAPVPAIEADFTLPTD